MNIRKIVYEIKSRLNFQAIKQSWLDLKRDKAKLVFALSGIIISVFLFISVLSINDSLNYNYIKTATATTGEPDIMISRTLTADLTYDPFFDESIISEDLNDISQVDGLFPRIAMFVDVSSETSDKNTTVQIYGLNFMEEYSNGKMGDLIIVDDEGKETGQVYSGTPENDECVVLRSVAEYFNVTKGDTIHLTYQQNELDLTVVEVCKQDRKFMEFETALILLNLNNAQNFLNREGQINFVYGTIENRQQIYDAGNLDATTQRLRSIGNDIQNRLDINEYSVSMPKLEELEEGQFYLMMATVLFWFIIMLTVLITGILINSILSTSAEERMREFGIMRVVGGKKQFSVKIVLFEGLLLGIIGSVAGTVLGFFLTEPLLKFFLNTYDFGFSSIDFIIQPTTIISAVIVGILVSLGVSAIPAVKAARKDLIKSITPFRSQEEVWEVRKETSAKFRLVLVGIAISIIGLIMFILMPRVFVTGDFMLISWLFIGLLAAILIGLVFTSVGVIPLIQRIFLFIISPAIRKYFRIIKISLKRYRRRNVSTILMFSISFSFIFFITTLSQMEQQNTTVSLSFQYGSDIVMINDGGNDIETSMTQEMIDEIRDLDEVNELAIALHNTVDLQVALGALIGGDSGLDEESLEDVFRAMFARFMGEERTKYITHAADIPNFDEVDAGFIGVNQRFVDLIDKNLIVWESAGSGQHSFSRMLSENDTCIISKAIADRLNINDVGGNIRLTFFDPQLEDDPGNITIFEVVGISGGMPGFWNFRSSAMAASGGGVMVSLENYQKLMDVKNAGKENMIIDKVYLNLKDNSEAKAAEFMEDMRTAYSDKEFTIDDVISKINSAQETSESQSALFELILIFTVLIAIFGLISNMYAVIKERKFEIGILRSMGLKTRNVRHMFLIESIIIMLSAALMGMGIGIFSAYLLETTMASLTEMPVIFSMPWLTLFRVFSISVIAGIIGMYVIVWKVSKQDIVEIFRQSF
ncbi:MAG: FtsX-like permease family protein [Promethearchaeota archaeon]|nr:MAG: FtsX-like permease family protein [Candidatus Lokiarchaeota archaeon]